MITNIIRGDIFKTPHKHIAFAIDREGYNGHFGHVVASRFWPELETRGRKKLGSTMSVTSQGKTFHALVCHFRNYNKSGVSRWKQTATLVESCLNQLDVPAEETLAVALMGTDAESLWEDNRSLRIQMYLASIARSQKRVEVYDVTDLKSGAIRVLGVVGSLW